MILSAIGSIVGGIAAYSQSMYQSAIATANSKQAKLNAELASEIAQSDMQDMGIEQQGMMGELIAGQAASGIAVSSPSAVRARIWQAAAGYKDTVRRAEAGSREYANYRTQSNVYKAEAAAHKTAGMFSLIGGFIQAGTSLVGASASSAQSPGYLPSSSIRQRYSVPSSYGSYTTLAYR